MKSVFIVLLVLVFAALSVAAFPEASSDDPYGDPYSSDGYESSPSGSCCCGPGIIAGVAIGAVALNRKKQ